MPSPAPGADSNDASPSPFADRVNARSAAVGAPICLGIDPRPERHPSTHPDRHGGDPAKVARSVVIYFRAILEATHDRLAAVKPQSAFFERMGIPGMIALAQLVADARELDLPVVLDAKRGDIGSTAEAYAEAYLGEGVFAADALTVNPYLGFDTLRPFVDACDRRGRGIFVLVRTSNRGAAAVQLHGDPEPLFRLVAREVEALSAERRGASGYGPVGAVVGATDPEAVAAVREAAPSALLLVPGYGAQGGSADAAQLAFDDTGTGALIAASRSLTYPASVAADAVADAARAASGAVDAMHAALTGAR